MAYETPITIAEVMKNISADRYLCDNEKAV